MKIRKSPRPQPRPGPRADILHAANRVRDPQLRELTMRNLQEAVCIVRRRRLVSNETLVLAGFNPVKIPR